MKVRYRHDIKSNIYYDISAGLIKTGVVLKKRFPELASVLRTKGNCEKYSSLHNVPSTQALLSFIVVYREHEKSNSVFGL